MTSYRISTPVDLVFSIDAEDDSSDETLRKNTEEVLLSFVDGMDLPGDAFRVLRDKKFESICTDARIYGYLEMGDEIEFEVLNLTPAKG